MPMRAYDDFTRPANTTAYTAADLIANNATAGSVEPLTFTTSRVVGQGTISAIRLYKSDPTATNANFTLHLFTTAPTVTNGDNGAFAIDTSRYHVGSIDCDMTTGGVPGTAGLSKRFTITNGITFDLSATNNRERRLYGFLVANAAYTPASGETFGADLEII